MGAFFIQLITNMIRFTTSRLAPNFVAACQPNVVILINTSEMVEIFRNHFSLILFRFINFYHL